MATRIQIRRDTEANWNLYNPILAEGELGLNLDNGKMKLGNGTQTWLQLEYNPFSARLDDLYDVEINSALNGDFLRYNSSASVWFNDAINLSTDTIGDYVESLVAGTGVTITNNSGEGATPTIAIGQSVSTSSSVTFAEISGPLVGNVTGDVTGNADTATALETARTISLSGDVSGSVSFDGSSNVTITTEIQPNSVALGADTTGNFMSDVIGGTGVIVTHAPGESSSASIAIGQDVATTASVSFAHVSAEINGNVTGDLTGNADTATALETSRTFSLSGDLSGSVSFDGTSDVTIAAQIQPNSIVLGTDTTGNYVSNVSGGTGVLVTHTPGEGSSPTISIGQDVATTASVTFANIVVSGDLTVNGTTTTLNTENLLVEDNLIVLNSNTTGSPTENAGIEIERGTSPNVQLRWNESTDSWEITEDGSIYKNIAIGQDVETTSSVSFAHVASDVTGNLTGNASTATTLETARTISLAGDLSGSVSFDGSQNVTITADVQPNSVALGTDTTGNFVADVVAGTGINITHTPGEGSSASIALNAGLNELGDVVIVGSPERFQTLGYDGAGWVNSYAPVVSYVRNAESTTLTVGTVVYLFGGTGDHASVKRADNSSDTTSSKTVGIVGTAIPASENGPIITRGYARGMNLSGYSVGDVLWLGSNGQFTATKPSAPKHLVFVGVVVRATNNGIIYLATQNGYEIDELHNVKINGVTNGQFLRYNSASALWVNDTIDLGTDTTGNYVQNLVAGTGITLSNNSGEGATPTIEIGQDVSTSASLIVSQLETTHNLIVGGSLYVSGSVVTENQVSLTLDDPFIYLNGGSTETNPDLGIAGNYNDGSYKHAGIFRDATDGKFKFFDSYTPEPSSPIDVSHVSYSPAPVVAETFESTIATGTAPFTVASTTEVANLHADTASTLHTSRVISLAGDLSGSVSFDGSSDATLTAAIQPNSVELGIDTTGNYMVDLAEGTGVTIIHTPGEASTASISIGQPISASDSVQFVDTTLTGALVCAASATTVSTASVTSVFEFDKTVYRTGEFVVQVSQGSKFTSMKVIILHNGTTSFASQYGVIEIGSPAIPLTVSTDINSNNVRLRVAISDANSANAQVKVFPTLLNI